MSNGSPSGMMPRAWTSETRVVLQRVCVQLARHEPVRLEEQARERELNGVFEEAALRLEVMLRQVHAFVPHDVR